MTYWLLKKHFKFLIDEFGCKIEFKQIFGFTHISYVNSDIRVLVLGENYIRILISDADSLGTCYDTTEYGDEFKTEGSYSKKVAAAAKWLKHKLSCST